MGGKPDCVSEGLTLARAAYKLSAKAYEDGTDETLRNSMTMWMDVGRRCNYLATVEGITINKMAINYINSMDIRVEFKAIARIVMIGIEICANLIDNVNVIVTSYMGFKTHWDIYSVGLLGGTLIKLVY